MIPLTTGALIQKTLKADDTPIPTKIELDDHIFPHPYFSSTINDIFRKVDLAVNGSLSAGELKQLGKILNEVAFTQMEDSDFTSESYQNIS